MSATASKRPLWRSLNLVKRSCFSAPVPVRFTSTKTAEPLRILFCGSDDFSGAALRALHNEHVGNHSLIESIDVVIRPGKATGRNGKNFKEVPVKAIAQELGLRIHERDTFTGWTPPAHDSKPINLIIAVSFGLFVPPRLLNAATYGGLNVHPSLLPDLRGPAPLQHTLLAGRRHIGITLQTLHPAKFDAGKILAQTPYPGLEIPDADTCTYPELLEFVTPKAANLLVDSLRKQVYVPPLEDKTPTELLNAKEAGKLVEAPKITKQDQFINWKTWSAVRIERYERVLGRLWSQVQLGTGTPIRRAIFGGLERVELPPQFQRLVEELRNQHPPRGGKSASIQDIPSDLLSLNYVDNETGETYRLPAVQDEENQGSAIILTSDLNAVKIKSITLNDEGKKPAARVLERGNSGGNDFSWNIFEPTKSD